MRWSVTNLAEEFEAPAAVAPNGEEVQHKGLGDAVVVRGLAKAPLQLLVALHELLDLHAIA